MNDETRNIYDVLDGMSAHWSPTTIATVNDYDVRVVRVLGEFTRHSHPETDEFFLVLSGSLAIRMPEGEVTLGPGDTYVVERGRPHQPYAENETTVLLFEPSQNILLDVETQLRWLREIGFDDVDCHWKWRELALLAGLR